MPDREKVIAQCEWAIKQTSPTIIESKTFYEEVLALLKEQEADKSKYQYKYDHTDCIWYHSDEENRCPSSCSQYRDGWNDAMDYIFKDGKGYQPYIRKEGR